MQSRQPQPPLGPGTVFTPILQMGKLRQSSLHDNVVPPVVGPEPTAGQHSEEGLALTLRGPTPSEGSPRQEDPSPEDHDRRRAASLHPAKSMEDRKAKPPA